METTLETRKIEIEQDTLKQLNSIRKWTMFLAIIGFIFLGLFIVMGALAGTFLSVFNSGKAGLGIPESLMYVIFLALAVIYFIPIHFLFRFSKLMATAMSTLDKQKLHKAVKNLKYFFAYLGVLIIIGLAIYVVTLIIEGSSMQFLKSQG